MNTAASPTGFPVVAVVFARLGPYHVARIRGAVEVLGREGAGVTALAVAGSDRVYAWDRVDETRGCPTRVLFPEKRYEDVPAGRTAHGLHACLDETNPLAVALPGWAFTEAHAGLAWCRRNGRPAILMSESARGDHFRFWPREFLKRRMVRRFGAALVGGVRHREYAKQLGIPRAAIFTGYDVVDNDYFQTACDRLREEADAARKAHRLPGRYVLTSSRFVALKNIDGLLRAYSRYAARAPAARDLVVCGDGEQRDRLQALARTLNVEHRIHWPGFVQYPELPVYYALADAFILASTTEPWGLVVNEAMASGLPVLVSDRCGCAPDLVREGENGFTFDPCNVEDIAGALLKLPDDPGALARLGSCSRQIVSGFSPQAFGEGLLEAARMSLARLGRYDLGLPGGCP